MISAPKETELEEVKEGRGLGAVILNRVTREGLPEKGTSELKGVREGREPCGHRGKASQGTEELTEKQVQGKQEGQHAEGVWRGQSSNTGQTCDEATRSDTKRLWAFCQVRREATGGF